MNPKPGKMKTVTGNVSVKADASCCGGVRSAEDLPPPNAAEKPSAETRLGRILDAVKGKSKGCCCGNG